ncbi:MAG: hypothetical protein AAF196_19075 [Planctomycetota bacterium]
MGLSRRSARSWQFSEASPGSGGEEPPRSPLSSARTLAPLKLERPRRILAGLDEAGLGPLLGPLVAAGTVLEGPAGVDPWEALAEVAARARPNKRQIQVTDSKKVHNGPNAKLRLERTVLTSLALFREALPETSADLLESLAIDVSRFEALPWFEELEVALPLHEERAVIEDLRERLRLAADSASIRGVGLHVELLEVPEFNRAIARTDNKSTAHLELTFDVLGRVLADPEHLPDRILCDRFGGRAHYRSALARSFPRFQFTTINERRSMSHYRCEGEDDYVCELLFASGGEDRAFPCALASCFAKYVRELLISAMNRWFADRLPGLTPTAGYTVDGRRFLEDVEAVLQDEQVPEHLLVRCR